MTLTTQEQQAANRAALAPSDLDKAVNVLQKIVDEQGEYAEIYIHTRVRNWVIVRLEFSTCSHGKDIVDLVELNNNTALAWLRIKQNKVQLANADTTNEATGAKYLLQYLEKHFGNARVRRLNALLED